MSLYLFIAAAIGLAIFLLAYLAIVIASFRHHTVTGLVALIPGINLAVLPSVWSRVPRAFPLSLLGLILALATWYSGGHQYFRSGFVSDTHYTDNATAGGAASVVTEPAASSTSQARVANIEEVALPDRPLYYLVYQTIEHSQLPQVIGQQIRVTLIDGRQLEGKNIKAGKQSVLIESGNRGEARVFKIATQHIQMLEKLTRIQDQ